VASRPAKDDGEPHEEQTGLQMRETGEASAILGVSENKEFLGSTAQELTPGLRRPDERGGEGPQSALFAGQGAWQGRGHVRASRVFGSRWGGA
jgi:hypothetical protein